MVPVRTPSAADGHSLAAALLTTTQVGRRDGVTPKAVRERIKAGRLLGVKVGDRWLVVEPRP